MKTLLSIQILTKDNQETIEECIKSLSGLNANIIIGDLGSKDNTLNKCQKYQTTIYEISASADISQARNKLIKNCNSFWHMMIEPWERLTDYEVIKKIILGEKCSYNFGIIQGDILLKDTRLWHTSLDIKYENPIYETIKTSSKNIDVYLLSSGGKRNLNIDEFISQWQNKNPLNPQPFYYKASTELIKKNWDAFLNYADAFLHQQKTQDMAYFMTCYYTAMVLSYIKKQHTKAIQMLSPCILKYPTLAEFWCLLGDIHYSMSQFEKAKCFYENAKILGSRRLNSCEMPMEISKYQTYPQKMIDACKLLENNIALYANQ